MLENEIKIISTYDQKISESLLNYYDTLWNNKNGIFTLPYDEHKNERQKIDDAIHRACGGCGLSVGVADQHCNLLGRA